MNNVLPEFPPTPIFNVASEMTLRDHFALVAMRTMLDDGQAWDAETYLEFGDNIYFKNVAICAYRMADAMLAERAKT